MSTLYYGTEATVTFYAQACGADGCGVVFGMPDYLYKRRVEDHKSWYCPNGHQRHFTGPSEQAKAERRADELARRLASREEDVRAARMQAETERRRAAAARGQLTKARNRASKGVCLHCNRSFVNVQRHVAHMHPETVQS